MQIEAIVFDFDGLLMDTETTLLERLGLDPARAIAVEDTPHGVTGAKAAGDRKSVV